MDLTTLVQEQLAEQRICSNFIRVLAHAAISLNALDMLAKKLDQPEALNDRLAEISLISLAQHVGLIDIYTAVRRELLSNDEWTRAVLALGATPTEQVERHVAHLRTVLHRYLPIHDGDCSHD